MLSMSVYLLMKINIIRK